MNNQSIAHKSLNYYNTLPHLTAHARLNKSSTTTRVRAIYLHLIPSIANHNNAFLCHRHQRHGFGKKITDIICSREKNVWVLARAPDLYSSIRQLLTSSNNSIQHPVKVPRRTQVPDELAARALNKDTWHVTVPDSLSTTEKRQSIGYNSRSI